MLRNCRVSSELNSTVWSQEQRRTFILFLSRSLKTSTNPDAELPKKIKCCSRRCSLSLRLSFDHFHRVVHYYTEQSVSSLQLGSCLTCFLFFFKVYYRSKENSTFILHLGCVLVVSSSCCFLAANFTGSGVKSLNCPLSSQMVTFVLFREWVMDSPTWGNKLWSVKEAGRTNLTGLLVRDTRRDSRQWNSFSSVMPERSSWTYSWDESVNSCLLFLSPPCERNRTEELPRRCLQRTLLVWMEIFFHRYKSC